MRAQRAPEMDVARLVEKIARALERDEAAIAELLTLLPSARIAHHSTTLLTLAGMLRSELARHTAQAERVAANAADRAARYAARELAKWEPYELESAKQTGFARPQDWRAYVDARYRARDPGFPKPEAWRQAQGLESGPQIDPKVDPR